MHMKKNDEKEEEVKLQEEEWVKDNEGPNVDGKDHQQKMEMQEPADSIWEWVDLKMKELQQLNEELKEVDEKLKTAQEKKKATEGNVNAEEGNEDQDPKATGSESNEDEQ